MAIGLFLLLICCFFLFILFSFQKKRNEFLNMQMAEMKYNLKIMPQLQESYVKIDNSRGRVVFVFPENFCLPCLQSTLQNIGMLEKELKKNFIAVVPVANKVAFEVYNKSFKMEFETVLYRDDFKKNVSFSWGKCNYVLLQFVGRYCLSNDINTC